MLTWGWLNLDFESYLTKVMDIATAHPKLDRLTPDPALTNLLQDSQWAVIRVPALRPWDFVYYPGVPKSRKGDQGI